MNYNSPARNLGLAWVLARDLDNFNQGMSDSNRALAFTTLFPSAPTVQSWAENATRPAYTLVQFPGVVMIGFLGARTNSLALNFFNETITRTHPHQQDGYNGAAWDVQDIVLFSLQNIANLRAERIIIYGHSFGGACAIATAGCMYKDSTMHVSCITYGAPRCVRSQPGTTRLTGVDMCRYNVTVDSVVRFPPRANEATLLGALESETQLDNLARWTQVGAGVTLSPTASPVDEMLPPLLNTYQDLSLWNFLINNSALTSVGHRISTYQSLLYVGASQDGSINLDPPSLPPSPLSRPTLESQGQRFPDPAGAAQVAALEQQFATISASTRNNKPYVWKRTNEGPGVFYLDQQVSWHADKRSARSFAGALNKAFHLWWKSRFGATATLQQSINETFDPAP